MVNYILKFLTILLITIYVHGQCTRRKAHTQLQRSLYEFTTKLSSRVNQETESHFVVSGFSAWSLISTLSLGAADETLAEIKEVLRLHPRACINKKYFEILKHVGENDGGVLEHGGAVFLDEKMNIYDQFKSSVTSTGISKVHELPWNDGVETATAINNYVKSATHEAIDEIVTPSDLDGVALILIDALYFKGIWRVPFPYENTEPNPFYNSKGNLIGNVSMMYVIGPFKMTSLQEIGARVLELPYGDDSRYSMLIFLPYTSSTVTIVIESLTRVTISYIFTLFEQRKPQTTMVQIPRFKVVSDINNLKELLTDMGLKSMFDSSAASFPAITDEPIYVANLIQKAHIEVTEEVIVPAPVSEAVFDERMLPHQFTVNKPFLFMIVDRTLNIPLFTGAYSKPTVF